MRTSRNQYLGGLTFALIGGLALSSVSACTTDDPPPSKQLTAVTFNGGLAVGFVGAAEERSAETIAAIADLAADVVCVQEIWKDEHVQALKTAAAGPFPNQVFLPDDAGQSGAAACTMMDLADLNTCVAQNGCDTVCNDDLVGCVLAECSTPLNALPMGCYECLLANVGNSLDDIIDSCTTSTAEYAFGGAFGIGLLSSYPIVNQDVTVFTSTTNRRAAIHAQLDTELGEVHAFCTHLTAVFDDVAFPDPNGSWEAEQAAQIDELLAWADTKSGGTGAVLIMGDFNTGPAKTGISAEVPDHYTKFETAGYRNPYVDATDSPACTFCGNNPLISGSDDVVIDHIFVKGLDSATAESSRVLDTTIDVTKCGSPFTTPYSDHYGLSLTLSTTEAP